MTAAADELVRRLTELNQHKKDGHRSPHKPLLVLLALGNLARTGSSRVDWSDAQDRLAQLIGEFGTPSRTSSAQSAAYPFTRLRSDHVWQLNRDVAMDNVKPLGEEITFGVFVPELESALASDIPRLLGVAREVVAGQFPPSIAPDVLLAVGLDPEAVYLASPNNVSALIEQQVRRRSGGWRSDILQSWDYCCAFCGYDGRVSSGPVGIEAAHVRWFAFEGPDAPDNGMALCSLHHKLFDTGVIGLADRSKLQVSRHFSARSEAGKKVYGLHGYRLDPRPGTPLPAAAHVEWHGAEVFKGPALAS